MIFKINSMDKFLSLFENTELIKTNDYNNYKINYNDEQLKFIESPLQNAKLLGIPGGGKTQSIIGKVIYHYTKSDINQNNQFLILTFSKRACIDFIEKGKKQNRRLFNNKNIRTIHSIAGKIVYKIMEKRSSSQETVIISSIDLLNSNVDEIKEMDEFNNLKIIFIDEAQDISYIQYKFILKIAELTKCFIIMIGDPNQNIYQFQHGSDQYLLNHPGHTYVLKKNYRSTPHIVNFINQFRPWNNLTSEMISTKEDDRFNKKPIIFTGTIQEIIKDITNKIINSPFPKEEIAIISPVKKSKAYKDSYTNISLSIFSDILNDYNILFLKHYEESKNEEEISNDIKKVKNHINLITIHGSKGLEFKQVFLLNFHTCTMGIVPTEEKYKEFKYLWYVGLSRASYDLNIYIDKNKQPWNELKNCSADLYDINNIKLTFNKEIKFSEEILPISHSLNKILDEKLLYELENTFKYTIETEILYPIDENNINLKNNKENILFYEIFIKNIFYFYYNKVNNTLPYFIIKLKNILSNIITIPQNLINSYKILKLRCPFISNNLIKLSDFSSIKNKFKKQEEEIYTFLCKTLNFNYNKEFYLESNNNYIENNKNKLLESILYLENSYQKDDIILNHLLIITNFYYQIEFDSSDILNRLNYFIKNAIHLINSISNKFKFENKFIHPKLPIIGTADLIDENKIINIKFNDNLNIKHIFELILIQHLKDPKFEKDYQLEIWNFQLGLKYIIKINKSELNIYKLLKILSKSINTKLENMIFVYDLETTGFLYSNKKIDIIDRHFEELTTSIIISTGLLKPVDVPFIPFEITKLTGITKEMVYESGDHFSKFKSELEEVMEFCHMPIFIAHNGNSFDHKILINKNIITNFNCKLLDSRIIIKLFLNDDVTNKCLLDIFQYLFKYTPIAHRANSDVKMLILIFQKLEITEEKILNM